MKDDTQKNTIQDDVTLEETEQALDDVSIEEEEEVSKDTIKKLKEKIKQLEKESAENLLGWQRTKADYVNAKKEQEKSRIETIKYANEEFALELLPALDAFDMAMANKESWSKVDATWRSGVEYIYNQIQKAFETFGITIENPVGQKVDFAKHNPVGTLHTDDESKKDTVAEVMQKGYVMNGKPIRPASVKVFE